MSKLLEERLSDWVVWYNHNLKTLPKQDVIKRAAFLEKAMIGALECLLIAAKDIKDLEGVRRQLYLPSGALLRDDRGNPMQIRTEDNDEEAFR